MSWLSKRAGRVPTESEIAKQEAEKNLCEVMEERHAVQDVVHAIKHELAQNHISQRIGVLLKEGK